MSSALYSRGVARVETGEPAGTRFSTLPNRAKYGLAARGLAVGLAAGLATSGALGMVAGLVAGFSAGLAVGISVGLAVRSCRDMS